MPAPTIPAFHFPGTVTDLIAAQAARTPDRLAMTWSGGDAWTYAQLMALTDTIAHRLLERGVERGELVGVYFPRRPEMVAAVLGVMRAGAAYVPLESKFPDARLSDIAYRANIKRLIVWQASSVPKVLSSGTELIPAEGLRPIRTANAPFPKISEDDLAYLLFTSGSTGKPKGVRVLHRNLLNDLGSLLHEPGVSPHDVMGAFTNLSFDPSVHEIFLPLLVGARMVVATENEQDDALAASRLLKQHPMTMLQSSPVVLQTILNDSRGDELNGMKLWVGGEAMPRDLANTVLSHCEELWNMYGPTEATVEATIHRVTRGHGPIPIGKPIANTTIHLLDDKLVPVKEGEVGEIWIGGAGVADGYLNDPERTAERFVSDPFAGDGSRMYRTGDLGSLRDGLYYCHGRVDDQINLHGARIEPGEIESVALAQPGIHQAVAMARDVAATLCIVLYVVADSDPDVLTQLRVALRTTLPVYMLPRYVVRLEAMPKTLNGKVDRKALPLPETHAASVAASPGAPRATPPLHSTVGGDDRWCPLTTLQPHGQRPPLFLIHGIDGSVAGYAPLARSLGAEQPVHGIRAPGLDGLTAPLESIPVTATHYQRVQPRGPYFLAGAALGGLIAYEMACQLHEQGESVALLALFDTHAPGHGNKPGLGPASPIARIREAFDAVRVRRTHAAGKALSAPLRHREILRAHRVATGHFHPKAYPGELILLKCTDSSTSKNDTAGWSDFSQGRIEVIEMPGNPQDFITKPELLRAIKELLHKAQAGTVSPTPVSG